MVKFRILGFLSSILLLWQTANAQQWVEKMDDPTVDFYTLQREFNQYWQGRAMERGKGWKAFKRYEEFMEPRVYPSGDRKLPSRAWKEFETYQASRQMLRTTGATANWTAMGPFTVPSGGGAGRINFVRFHPSTPSTIYVGAPAGGLWKSTNGGASWSTNTDNLAVIGVSDLAIDPSNPTTMYLATGDGDAGDTRSLGVLKSTDGGATWAATGLTWTVNQGYRIRRLAINPNNPAVIMAATSAGIYRTTNGGSTWALNLGHRLYVRPGVQARRPQHRLRSQHLVLPLYRWRSILYPGYGRRAFRQQPPGPGRNRG